MVEYKFIQKPYVLTQRCEELLDEALVYISETSPEQARIMRTQFTQTCKMIERMPRIGVAYEKGMRKIKLGKFRYNIYYKETKKTIEILGIWHTSKGSKF
jgi:plasmid stabilization system protein ParE